MSVEKKSLPHWRTAPTTIFVVAIFILVVGLGIILQNESTFRAARNRQAMVAAQVLAQSVTAAVDFGDPVASQQAVDAFRVNPQVRYVGVYDRTGRLLAVYDRIAQQAPREPRVPKARSGQQLPGHRRRSRARSSRSEQSSTKSNAKPFRGG